MAAMRRLIGLLAALLLAVFAFALPHPAAACTGFLTPFEDAIPHAASIYVAHIVSVSGGGPNRVVVDPGPAIRGATQRVIPTIVAGPSACNPIEAGQDGVVVLVRDEDFGRPTAFGQNLFYKFGHVGGTARVLVDEALRAEGLPDTATEPPGADDPERPHADPGVWPLLVLIVALFVFGLVLRGSQTRRKRGEPLNAADRGRR
jgi:hypothetical protein